MQLNLLIKQRNGLVMRVLWISYLLMTIFYLLIDPQITTVWPPVGFVICILCTILVKVDKYEEWIMYTIITAVIGYLSYLNWQYPYLVNYIFLLFGIIIASLYQSYKAILYSGVLTLISLVFFYLFNFEQIFSSIIKLDVIYFILFAVLLMIFFFYHVKFTRILWLKAQENEKMTKEQLSKTEEKLIQSEKLSMTGQLAAGIAHEIRNPLTVLSGFVQLLDKDEKNREIMLSEIERINLIVSELLILAKPKEINFHQVHLEETLNEVYVLFKSQFHQQEIQVNLCYSEDNFYILGNKNQLKQVFINIFKNAIEAIESEGFIDVSVKEVDRKIIATIFNNGPKIDDAILNDIGQPFITSKEKGTGLGLMISNKIVSDHGGELHIYNGERIGVTIEIALPVSLKIN
ncbi:GHKL domain-containing protein [Anaerobacillus alkaliphilus]|uniref:histidine kinase n=1 Tax=Anaerobacillus alkaliphilus TaxID=1548597 RepID=A0A4Q0VX27_9BACI|nr:ATP-binding protein [Anaerobacillus alkaliphilus]RXJ04297.1 GHKL domain-containing protein [Anaerobacillus alkaliphilus]